MEQVIIRKRYDKHDPKDYAHHPEGESLTRQEFKEESNVNNIMAKYEKGHMIDYINRHDGTYGDFSNEFEYREILDRLQSAEDAFLDLPSSLRNRFNNDPAQFIGFVSDDKNREEAIELGLIPKSKEPEQNPVDPPNKKQDKKTEE